MSRYSVIPDIRKAVGSVAAEHASGPPRASAAVPTRNWNWEGRNRTVRTYAPRRTDRAEELDYLKDKVMGAMPTSSSVYDREAFEKLKDGIAYQTTVEFAQREALQNYKAEADERLLCEFRDWLQGAHKANDKRLTCKVMDVEGKELPGTYVEKEHTTWGKKDLLHLDGVRDFLRRDEEDLWTHDLELAKLHYFGPQNLDEAWKYFTHLVKRRPTTEDVCFANKRKPLSNTYSDFSTLHGKQPGIKSPVGSSPSGSASPFPVDPGDVLEIGADSWEQRDRRAREAATTLTSPPLAPPLKRERPIPYTQGGTATDGYDDDFLQCKADREEMQSDFEEFENSPKYQPFVAPFTPRTSREEAIMLGQIDSLAKSATRRPKVSPNTRNLDPDYRNRMIAGRTRSGK